jgi:hypothetical protein
MPDGVKPVAPDIGETPRQTELMYRSEYALG